MKKWIALLTAMIIAISMAACGGSEKEKSGNQPESEVKEEVKEEKPAEKKPEDSQGEKTKEEKPEEKLTEEEKPTAETPEEYEAAKEAFKAKSKEDFTAEYLTNGPMTKEKMLEYKALQRYEDFNPDNYTLMTTNSKYTRVGIDVQKAGDEAGIELTDLDYVKAFIDSPYPQLKVTALGYAKDMMGGPNKEYFRPVFEKMMAEETEVHVLAAMARPCMNNCSDPAVAEFILKLAKHEDPVVRAAATIAATGTDKDVPGLKDTLLAMLADPEQNVRGAAAKAAANFGDPAVIPQLGDILMKDEEAAIHGQAAEGLARFCYDYPIYKNTNADAYKFLMDYLKKTPRTQSVPEWTVISLLSKKGTPEKMAEWKTKATYFDENELANTLIEIIKDKEAAELSRRTAIQAAAVHATDEQFESIKPLITGEMTLESAYESELNRRQKK